MHFLNGLVPTLLVLGVLILIHEWGHFLACRLSGVRVEKFSIGFGPEIFHKQGRQTRYAIGLLPFGGYVKPSGESISEIGAEGMHPYDYLAASVPKRIFIVTAGVGMNYLLSFVLFIAIFVHGRPVPLAQIGGFVEGYPAEKSGLTKGDRILTVAGEPVHSWEELTNRLSQVAAPEVELGVQRGSRVEPLHVPVRIEPAPDLFGKKHSVARLGILPDREAFRIEKLPPLPAVREAFLTEIHLAALTYKALFYLATGRLPFKTVSGPLGIMAMTGMAVKLGWVSLLHLMAVLSISLAVVNLLPIPALDGGHLLFLLIEGIQGHGVSLKFQERATQVGFALLIALMVFVLYNDFVNLQILDRVRTVFNR